MMSASSSTDDSGGSSLADPHDSHSGAAQSGGPFSFRLLVSRLADFRGASISITDNRRSHDQNSGAPRVQLRIGGAPSSGHEERSRRTSEDASTSLPNGSIQSQIARALSGDPQGQSVLDPSEPLDTLGSAAERYRLASSSQEINLEAVVRWVERCLPFLGILLIVFFYHHFAGIVLFAWLTFGLVRMDAELRGQVAAKAECSGKQLALVVIWLAAHIGIVLYSLSAQELWFSLMLLAPRTVPSVWDALYRVSILDLVIRFIAIIVKVSILAVCKCTPEENFKRRSQKLTLVEHVFQLYRTIVPGPIWYQFFQDAALGRWVSLLCTSLYFMFKCSSIYEKAGFVATACKAVVRKDISVGSRPTPEEIMECGSMCAICQETMAQPVKLQCNHVFCNSCISEWFERERTCPMCRAVVKPAGLNAYGDGSTGLLPQLF